MKGKLWLQKVDSIVSPCENTHLRHNRGIAKEIAKYAGP
jgi:O-acetyl-ADP-ribose deacetylase (regulator of RNase III)